MSRTVKSLLLALAATGLCLAGRATAQDMPASVFRSSTKRVHEGGAVDYREYYAEEPAKPKFEDATADAPKTEEKPAAEGTEEPAAEEEAKDDANPCGDPWTLQSVLTPCLGENTQWKYGGWIEAGVTGNDHGVVSLTGNLPVAFNYASDGAMLNQAWAFAERTAKTDGCGMDWGFRADYIFGTDAFFTQAFGDIGYDNNWDASLQYGSA
ncbi:MAG: porin, partial [Planctomycetia bacterium]|nr:porin [Planctomycetia bacterium]